MEKRIRPIRYRQSEDYSDLYLGTALLENEKPLLMRRLKRVLRGFNEKDIIKVRPALAGSRHCDVNAITEQILDIMDMKSNEVVPKEKLNKKSIWFLPRTPTFVTLKELIEASEKYTASPMGVRALVFLSLITRALLYDHELNKQFRIWADITDDDITVFINPGKDIDKSIDPNIKSMILARTLGVELSIERCSNGESCYRMTVSRYGEYLYDVRRSKHILDYSLDYNDETGITEYEKVVS